GGAGGAAAGTGRAGAAGGSGAGAGAGAPLAAPITASSAPTGTVSSWLTLISRTVPAAGDGISVSTLSVETSSSGSSPSTAWPTCFSQRVTVPSVTDSPSAGIFTTVPGPAAAGGSAAWARVGTGASAWAGAGASAWAGAGASAWAGAGASVSTGFSAEGSS